jgi:hypothetical protein
MKPASNRRRTRDIIDVNVEWLADFALLRERMTEIAAGALCAIASATLRVGCTWLGAAVQVTLNDGAQETCRARRCLDAGIAVKGFEKIFANITKSPIAGAYCSALARGTAFVGGTLQVGSATWLADSGNGTTEAINARGDAVDVIEKATLAQFAGCGVDADEGIAAAFTDAVEPVSAPAERAIFALAHGPGADSLPVTTKDAALGRPAHLNHEPIPIQHIVLVAGDTFGGQEQTGRRATPGKGDS